MWKSLQGLNSFGLLYSRSGVLFLEVGICFLIDGLQSHLTLGFRSFR